MSRRLLSALGTVLVVIIGTRVAAWIIEPVVVPVTVVLVVLLVAAAVIRGPWNGG